MNREPENRKAASAKATSPKMQNVRSVASQVNQTSKKPQSKTLGDELASWQKIKVEAYYDAGRKEYLMKNGNGIWQSLNFSQFGRWLRGLNISDLRSVGEGLSPVEEVINDIEMNKAVAYAAPLAGRKEGYYHENGVRFLVTEGPVLIEPVKGEWPVLKRVLGGLFAEKESEQIRTTQLRVFLGWLQVAVRSLRSGNTSFGQALAVAGEAGAGKSLVQNLITRLYG